jgi:rhamnosyl/mannosyltransferase
MADDKWRALHVGKFYPPYMGGMETLLQSLCEGLNDSIQTEALVANDGRETIVEEINGVKVTRVGTLLNLSAASVCPGMARRIRESKADLVHIHLPNPTAVLSYLTSRTKSALVFSHHSDIIRQKVLGKAFEPILRYALKRANAIVVATQNHITSSPIISDYKDKCHIVPFGINVAEFQERDEDAIKEVREIYGPRIVLSVGRLVYYKGFEYLIRAMKNVEGHLIIVGSGPLLESLEREAKDCGIANRVTILTDVKDARPFYHAADVFVLASIARSEAFGVVQLEAMACGTPVVNTNLDSGVPCVSLDGVTGLTVAPCDKEALSIAIKKLLDDSDLRAKFGEAGKRRVSEEFSVEVMTRRTLELYRKLLE